MFRKKLCVAFIAFLLLHDIVQGKKSKKNKHPKPEEDVYTPQPSVVSYSTFGFNDVGTYEGFVPSSPDYAKFLTGTNQESTKRDQSSGFSSSSDSNEFSNSFNSQPYSGQSFSMIDDGGLQTASLVQYPKNPASLFPSFDSNGDQIQNVALDDVYRRNNQDVNAPTYGTKLNSRNRIRPNLFNNTEFSGPSDIQNEEKFSNFHESKPTFDNRPKNQASSSFESKPAFSESSIRFYNDPSYPSNSITEYNKHVSSDYPKPVNFQRVVDFTKIKQYYPTELDISKLPAATPIPDVFDTNESTINNFINTFDMNNNSQKHFFSPGTKHRDIYNPNYNNEDTFEKNAFKANNFKEDSYHFSGYESGKDNLIISQSDADTKKKTKTKPWSSGGHLIKKWKEPSPSQGYEYSTNYSSMSFSYDSDKEKITKPLGSNIDELIPASSNIDLPNYQFLENDLSNFKKMPAYKVHEEEEEEFANFPSFKDVSKPNEIDYTQYKHLYTTTPATTAYWGNALKSSEYTSLKSHPNNYNKYKHRDNEEIVNIPRRPNMVNYEKPYENNQHEWSHHNRRPYKNRPYTDWNNDTPVTRFKSEEDLLGLRNQDTSHPSYLPNYQSNNFFSEEDDYKKLVDKWRQAYLKSKFKDSLHDYESYGTETKPKHFPVPKPYPIEVPHPVIVPIPQPYPVRVPIAKPVAVPVIRELKIPIEKPMPYLVYKDVPFPIEKPVPVRVEKEVPVPVVKPYPVHVPYIRPVFHHTKSRDEYDSDHEDEDDYLPRPEGKNKYAQYKKKIPNGPRNRSRRPSRTAYQDRNSRRWPEHRPDHRPDRRRPADMRDDRPRVRPIELPHLSPFKRPDSVVKRFEGEPSNFYL